MWLIEDFSNNTLGEFAKRSSEPESQSQQFSKRVVDNPAKPLELLLESIDKLFHTVNQDSAYALYPNPFYGMPVTKPGPHSSPHERSRLLKLVDGSESGQTIPLWGQIQPARHADFIIAFDSTSDAWPYAWNNGTNLYNTYLASKSVDPPIPFPVIPPPYTFIEKNYTNTPVFFGCDANLTTTGSRTDMGPLILYMANSPYSAYTNFSYTQEEVSQVQIREIFTNEFNMLTQGNSTLDAEWPECLGLHRTSQCESCLQRYCWNGEVAPEAKGSVVVDLPLKLNPVESFAMWNASNPY